MRKLFQGALLKDDIICCLATSSGVILFQVGLEPANYLVPRLIGEEEANIASQQLQNWHGIWTELYRVRIKLVWNENLAWSAHDYIE